MARGSMKVGNISANSTAEILNRKEKESVAMTIDFADVTKTDDLKRKIVKAGTPIDKDGKPISATPWTGAVGILQYDVIEDYPQGTVLTVAYIHTGRAQTNSGLTYDGALVTAMNNAGNRIRFEEPIITATVASGASL